MNTSNILPTKRSSNQANLGEVSYSNTYQVAQTNISELTEQNKIGCDFNDPPPLLPPVDQVFTALQAKSDQ